MSLSPLGRMIDASGSTNFIGIAPVAVLDRSRVRPLVRSGSQVGRIPRVRRERVVDELNRHRAVERVRLNRPSERVVTDSRIRRRRR